MVGRKWFLPSVKEWVQLFNTTIPSAGLGAVLFDFGQAMTAAGGTYKGGYSHLVTSSEWDAAQYLELYASTGRAPLICGVLRRMPITINRFFLSSIFKWKEVVFG